MGWILNGVQVLESEIRQKHYNSSIPYPMELRHIEQWGYEEVQDPVTEPIKPKVQTVSMRQARLALKKLGMYKQVNTVISQLGEEAQIEWEYAIFVERDFPLVKQMQSALNLTDNQVDDLFTLADSL